MKKILLHFRITLDEAHNAIEARLLDEINRRWPFIPELDKNGRKVNILVSTCTATPGDHFAIEIEGWPACQQGIRAFLMDRIEAWMK